MSGLIIDTPSSFANSSNKAGAADKYAFIKTCIELFRSEFISPFIFITLTLVPVNTIIVIGHEKLNVEMRREFGNSLAVVKIPKSGGVRLSLHKPPHYPSISLTNTIAGRRTRLRLPLPYPNPPTALIPVRTNHPTPTRCHIRYTRRRKPTRFFVIASFVDVGV